ncbi:MAG: NAD(P)-dependent oxidoreductase [Bacteroidetes bacterium]|nr:MAG: NAD(P)-dependent oxidoreductase [Bacteroidota bacterium]
MRILVTGANGLLGQKLVALLLKQKDVAVLATSRGKSRIQVLPEGSYYTLDVTNREDVIKQFSLLQPDVVIHTAAMTQVDDCELNPEDCKIANIEAVKNVVAGCEQVNAHLVHLSTDFIFDGSEGPLLEDASPNPVNFYGETKLVAEKVIIDSGISWSIARTVLVYGIVPGLSRSNIILWVKENLENHKTIKVVDDQWRTPTLAEDLAEGCWLLAKNKVAGVYNISGKDMLTPYEMAQMVAEYFNLDNSYITQADSSTFSQPAKRPPKTGFIIDKAINELGYNPHSFKEGIEIIADQVK